MLRSGTCSNGPTWTVPRNSYRTSDNRWVVLSGAASAAVMRLFRAIGRPDLEKPDIRRPGFDPLHFLDAYVKESLQDGKKPAKDPVEREVGPQFLLGDGIAMLA